ncbi:MAG: type I-C CRISPR-associated protein Cas7/Csd2 [Candidatus Brocadia sp.]|nr:MAG: type I-C CRISPR-associated protein Cas7/Csd2 [Candidatus Brocadia sp.]
MVLLFDAKKANPNGDPDAENMPRIQPNTLKGMVTDVCLKRKIRNFFSLYKTDGNLKDNPESGYDIFIKENAILQQLMEAAPINASAKRIFIDIYKQNETAFKKGNEFWDISHRDALCQTYFDLRAFGGVISTEGPLKGSFYGQVRGPIQFSFAESLDKVLQLDATITRCCSTSEKEKKEQEKQSEGDEKTGGNRTMGRKYNIDYGLYRAHIYFSPAFAAKTGFTYFDLDNFLFAMTHMFTDDPSSNRSGMRVVGLVDFQHSRPLGNEHAHKLFDMVKVEMRDKNKDYPDSINDYFGCVPGQVDGNKITVKKVIWEIPEKS